MKWFVVVIVLTISIAACAPVVVDAQAPAKTSTLIPTLTVTNTVQPVKIIVNTPTPLPISKTSTPLPLQISFPPPISEPKSIWRPPLYPQPFALSPHDHFYFSRPISVDEVNWPLANYRYGYIDSAIGSVHTGIDIDAPIGTSIIAAASGTVIWSGYGLLKHDEDPKDPYGLAVVISHDFGYQGLRLTTVYAHMSSIDVKVGQYVSQGQPLGKVGMTGFTTGPHVHFEVRLESSGYFTTRNPELWLSPPEGDGLIVGQFNNGYGGNLGAYKVTVTSPSGERIIGYTYGPNTINSDDYYRENYVLSDLPAGTYQVEFTYLWKKYSQFIEVFPGQISYFTFNGRSGFSQNLPAIPENSSWLIPLTGH